MSKLDLTLEQQFQVSKMILEVKDMSKEQLEQYCIALIRVNMAEKNMFKRLLA